MIGSIRTWVQRWWLETVVIATASGLLWAIYEGDYGYPPETLPSVVVGVLAVVLGVHVGSIIVSWFDSTQWTFLIDFDARDAEIAVYRLNPEAMAELEVVEGELYHVKAIAPCYFCKQFDPENLTCKSTWLGSANDKELVEERERIREIREELEEMAQEGLSMRIRSGTIVRRAVRMIAHQLVGDVDGITIYEGDLVEQAVEQSMKEFDYGDEKEDAKDDDEDGQPATGPDPTRDGEQTAVADGGPT